VDPKMGTSNKNSKNETLLQEYLHKFLWRNAIERIINRAKS
jgi:hypothetical protein